MSARRRRASRSRLSTSMALPNTAPSRCDATRRPIWLGGRGTRTVGAIPRLLPEVAMKVLAAAAIAAASILVPAAPAMGAPAIVCDYRLTTFSGGFFMADLFITNNGPDIVNGWTARWTFREPTTNLQVWMAVMTIQNNTQAYATNLVFNAVIPQGQTRSFGWSATATATSVPTDITVNGVRC